jgi:gliding motility-associated transport system ATP-binding protein
MLEAKSLVRSYGDFKAVDDVSFTIGDGQIVGLLGHNGAGKTTIMKMLSGYMEPDTGSILMDGEDIASNLTAFQKHLGYLPESLPIYPDMLVADYLDYAANLKGLNPQERSQEIKRVIQETGIQEKVLSPISTLSRGFKQRVGVAQAILGSPKLLILDEPTNGLDPAQTEQMRTLIRGVAKRATVILSTHIMQEVDALCQRVLILKNGSLALDADLQELRCSRQLELFSSLPFELAKEFFEQFEELESWERVESFDGLPEGSQSYRLQLNSEQERFQLSARLVSSLVAAEHEVFKLDLVVRDLESVVREIGAVPQMEVRHAA